MFYQVCIFIFLFVNLATGQNTCDFYQNVQVGRTYDIVNPNYPRNYTPGTACRWIAVSPTGYNVRLDCPVVVLPQSSSCSTDRLMVSRSGDPQLVGADTYCGRRRLSAVSTAQQLVLGLASSRSNNLGGNFRCQMTAQAAPANPTDCSCGEKKQNRIVGGQETGINEYRMMAGLVDMQLGQIMCGGVIISNRYVLTTGQCLVRQQTNNVAVIVGEHDVTTGAETNATRAYRVERFIIHPLYSESNHDYDAGLVRTRLPMGFNDKVGPVCLPFKFINTNFTGVKVTTLGWGTLFPGGPTFNVLQKVELDVISQNTCRINVPTVTDRQMCTYTAGKDACQDDFGGPVLYTDPATGLLFNIGILSYGRSCASRSPGVSSRVPAILDWIVASTQEYYCRK